MESRLNRLARSNSPYLLQHAMNPVDWYEWGEEALSRARSENKPLIISIGYAACHWCHVMAHESFTDAGVAAFMNSHFVCIKVDREERPDIDQIYLEAAQYVSGSGGWPLNAFAFPDGRPFYAGTYFPRDQWYELLKRVVSVYDGQTADLEKQAEALTEALNGPAAELTDPDGSEFTRGQYADLIKNWEKSIDHQEGGFTAVPKFPLPVAWEFLLQYYYFTRKEEVLSWVSHTLQSMAGGGIYDHAGGGFSRYSTDKYWKVPHFEKMLYDNAQLISLYSHAYQVTRREAYAEIIKQTLGFSQRELMNSEGAFYSSLDADSDGEEGRFYTFTLEEFREAIDPPDFQIMADYYQVTGKGNWENGRNILFPKVHGEQYFKDHGLPRETFGKILNHTHEKLMQVRGRRNRPARDEKILTSWNALMIKALLDAYHALEIPAYLDSAVKTAAFLRSRMFDNSGILQRSYKDGIASVGGFLDDYSFLADAMINLYESTFDLQWLDLSRELTKFVLDHFSNGSSPLFFYTSDLSERLVARKTEISDNVIPSSNSVMAHVLIRLGHYYDEPSYISKASSILQQVKNNIHNQGPYFANYAMAIGWMAYAPSEIAIIGEHAGEKSMILQKNYLPASIIMGGIEENLPLLLNKRVKDKTLIYVCRGKICQKPVEDTEAALRFINDPNGIQSDSV